MVGRLRTTAYKAGHLRIYSSYTVFVVLGLKSRTLPLSGMCYTTDPFLTCQGQSPRRVSGRVYKTSANMPRAGICERLASHSNFPSAFEAKTGLDLLRLVLSPILLGFPDTLAPSLCAMGPILGTIGCLVASLGLNVTPHQLLIITPSSRCDTKMCPDIF